MNRLEAQNDREAGLITALAILSAKHKELTDSQKRDFDGKRHHSIGVLSQVIRRVRRAVTDNRK